MNSEQHVLRVDDGVLLASWVLKYLEKQHGIAYAESELKGYTVCLSSYRHNDKVAVTLGRKDINENMNSDNKVVNLYFSRWSTELYMAKGTLMDVEGSNGRLAEHPDVEEVTLGTVDWKHKNLGKHLKKLLKPVFKYLEI